LYEKVSKCLGRERMMVQSIYIPHIYTPLHILLRVVSFFYFYFFFVWFLYHLWRKDEEEWIGSNASTVETNWVAQRLFFFLKKIDYLALFCALSPSFSFCLSLL
jgi:hypothetical protein